MHYFIRLTDMLQGQNNILLMYHDLYEISCAGGRKIIQGRRGGVVNM